MFTRKVDAGWVTIDISPPIEQLEEDLRAIARDLDNFAPVLRRAVREVMIPSIRTNFERGGRPDRWTPLANSTLERRARAGTGSQILVETGALEKAATQFSRWGVTRDDAQITNWPRNVMVKAAVHQGGATVNFSGGERRTRHKGVVRGAVRPRIKTEVKAYTSTIPARPFLMIQDEDANRIEELFADWMAGVAARRWR